MMIRSFRAIGFVIILISLRATAMAEQIGATDKALIIPEDGKISIFVNDISGTARVEPSAPVRPVLDPDFAARAGLRSRLPPAMSRIGPEVLVGKSSMATVGYGGDRQRRVVIWHETIDEPEIDAVIGPMDFASNIIVFRLNAIQPNEKTFDFRLSDFSSEGHGYGLSVRIQNSPVRVFFKLDRRESLATAGAGTVIAAAFDGRFVGDSRETIIANQVSRPTRAIELSRPLIIGPLSITRFEARIADFGTTRVVERQPLALNEVVVTARSRRDRTRDWLTIGRDDLAACSSLTIDKGRMELRLSCRVGQRSIGH